MVVAAIGAILFSLWVSTGVQSLALYRIESEVAGAGGVPVGGYAGQAPTGGSSGMGGSTQTGGSANSGGSAQTGGTRSRDAG